MIFNRLNFWRWTSAILAVIASLELALLIGGDEFLALRRSPTRDNVRKDGFEAFESIAFAREFSERYLTFDSSNFLVTQTAVAFLLDDETRSHRLNEIERLQQKIESRSVIQRAKLLTLTQLSERDERFRAELSVDLQEGAAASLQQSQFLAKIEFRLLRTERGAQNPWGFQATNLVVDVGAAVGDRSLKPVTASGGAPYYLMLRPRVATLLRFPCSIENVELPKGTSVRVKLITLDVSELQMRTDTPISSEQEIRAVCRDRVFKMRVRTEDSDAEVSSALPLVVLKLLALEDSSPLVSSEERASKSRRRHQDKGLQKSIEEQLGFVVEE